MTKQFPDTIDDLEITSPGSGLVNEGHFIIATKAQKHESKLKG